MFDYRLRFSKEKKLKYLSHLELMRTIERAFRRSKIPLAFSEGFHPHPKLSFGPALAVGVSSNDEYLDFSLTQYYEPGDIKELLNKALPVDIRILAIVEIKHHVKPLNAVINRAAYSVLLKIDPEDQQKINNWLNGLLELSEFIIERRTKGDQKLVNIRPWLHNLTTEMIAQDILELRFTGEIGSGGHLRPEDITANIPQPAEILNIARIGLWHEENGFITKPLDFVKAGG